MKWIALCGNILLILFILSKNPLFFLRTRKEMGLSRHFVTEPANRKRRNTIDFHSRKRLHKLCDRYRHGLSALHPLHTSRRNERGAVHALFPAKMRNIYRLTRITKCEFWIIQQDGLSPRFLAGCSPSHLNKRKD